MRLRPFVVLSVAVVSAVLFAGCSGLGGGDETSSPTSTGSADLCGAAAPAGPQSDAVTATGDVGTPPEVSFDFPIDATELPTQRTVLVTGDGDELVAGDYLNFGYTILDGTTGAVLDVGGFEPGQLMPQQISPDGLGAFFGCATIGSRIAVVAATGDTTTPSVVYVLDALGINPTAAWGEEQAPVAGMPTVTLDADGTPNITVPTDDTPPTETEIAVLKKGDGYTVAASDQVLVQFRGARWSTGELFDGGDTWTGDSPYMGGADKFVPGFTKALVGQTVGSQVLVVIPPADGYGEGEINTTDLKGDTLVFVIDILGAQQAVPAAQ